MTTGILVNLRTELKDELKEMSKELGLSQTDLIRMATESLIVNYRNKGSFIFADLLNPDHKVKGGN